MVQQQSGPLSEEFYAVEYHCCRRGPTELLTARESDLPLDLVKSRLVVGNGDALGKITHTHTHTFHYHLCMPGVRYLSHLSSEHCGVSGECFL